MTASNVREAYEPPSPVARRSSSLNIAMAASPRLWCSSAFRSCTGPNRPGFRLAVTMRGPVMATACARRLRTFTASSMAGAAGFGFFAETIRIGNRRLPFPRSLRPVEISDDRHGPIHAGTIYVLPSDITRVGIQPVGRHLTLRHP
jgi:hypothetical protein